MISQRLQALIMQHEGSVVRQGRHRIYRDHLGNDTIGYGTLLKAGISEGQAKALMLVHLSELEAELLLRLEFYEDLNESRQAVLMSMAYQMGLAGLQNFKMMIRVARAQDWDNAAREMLESLWAEQTPNRADELARMMRRGKFPTEPDGGAEHGEEKEEGDT